MANASIAATVAYPVIANIIAMKDLLAEEFERRRQAAKATIAEMIAVTHRRIK
ncbi:hypothetical protein NUACC21_24860 [Scytonema sp. NUACC21]